MVGAGKEGSQLELDPRVDPERLLRDGGHTPFRERAALSVEGGDADHGPIVVDRDDGIDHHDEIRSHRGGNIEVADRFAAPSTKNRSSMRTGSKKTGMAVEA